MREYEAKFTDFDRSTLTKQLKEQGYVQIYPERLMTRAVFDLPTYEENGYARVRDEGDKVTMTIKRVHSNQTIDGVEEAELVIARFDEGIHFLETAGFTKKAYQETKREKWLKGNVEVVIDTWPGLPTFIEIEGPDKQSITQASEALGFNMADALYGAVDVLAEKFLNIPRHVLNYIPEITFAKPLQQGETYAQSK